MLRGHRPHSQTRAGRCPSASVVEPSPNGSPIQTRQSVDDAAIAASSPSVPSLVSTYAWIPQENGTAVSNVSRVSEAVAATSFQSGTSKSCVMQPNILAIPVIHELGLVNVIPDEFQEQFSFKYPSFEPNEPSESKFGSTPNPV